MIHLIGPGGAGKTTVGAALADRLNVPFLDLDTEFKVRIADISDFLDSHHYDAYARANVDLYGALINEPSRPGVVALSSGFMTYGCDVHPNYPAWRQRIAAAISTFVLLPSCSLEHCVTETVRRQLIRPFARTAEREEQVIRARFPIYFGLPCRKLETTRPVGETVDEIVSRMVGQEAARR